jgi:ADP-heptose:LPS heptosyltransferase
LAALKEAYPDSEIHVAVTSTWAPLLENHPAITCLWPYDRHGEKTARARAVARMALRLRKERFDCVLNFHASPSSATLAFATGARLRSIHFHGHHDRNRHSTVVVPGKGTLKPIIERDMDTVRALGLEIPAGRLPRLYPRTTEREDAQERFTRLGLQAPVLAIGLGASRPAKSWPVERFAGLAVHWARRTGGSAVALTGPDEALLAHDFMKAVDDALTGGVDDGQERAALRARVVVEAGMPVRRLAAFLERCAAFAGNDSGPKHVAVAVGTPTVTVFGPEHPFEWHPYPLERNPYLFVDGLPCRRDAAEGMPAWCGVHECREEQHKCMRQIGIEQVLEHALRVKRDAPAGGARR